MNDIDSQIERWEKLIERQQKKIEELNSKSLNSGPLIYNSKINTWSWSTGYVTSSTSTIKISEDSNYGFKSVSWEDQIKNCIKDTIEEFLPKPKNRILTLKLFLYNVCFMMGTVYV